MQYWGLSAMADSWLSYANLSDDYERRARFIPAVLALLPALPLLASIKTPLSAYVQFLLGGVGLSAIAAVGLSHAASAFGNRLQARLWPSWPHDAPTHRCLHPDNASVSSQQRKRWYAAIRTVVQLDIEGAAETGDPHELQTVINDAVQALRNRLWKAPEAERARMHNVEYGFARNLLGLWPVWCSLAVASLLGCWVAHVWCGRPIAWAIVATVVALALAGLFPALPSYVRRRADYYAESFLEAVVAVSEREAGNVARQGDTPP